MELWKVLGIAFFTLIVLALLLSVLNDANKEPEGPCEEITGSVCVPNNQCPENYEPTITRSCAISKNYLCCTPT